MNTRQKGFTLIELLVTIMVILLVSVMLIPFLGNIGADRTESAANEIQGYLGAAKQLAMRTRRHTALFVLPPTEYANFSRLMTFQLKENGDGTKLNGWQAVAGVPAIELPSGVMIRNAGGQSDCFYIWFDPQGMVSDECPTENLTLQIGPQNPEESRMRTIQYGIGRSGQLLRFTNSLNYVD